MRWWRLDAASPSMLIIVFVMIVFVEAVSGLSTRMGGGSSLDSSGERWGRRESSKGWFSAGGDQEEELAMDSEINSRILAESTNSRDKYISYGALVKGKTLCSETGAPYSNCRPGANEKPYNRGCSRNTGCYRSPT